MTAAPEERTAAPEERDASGALPSRGIRARRRPRFGALSESPFRVAGSAARERFWFADGAWLDQGQSASVVGVVWTHWLADRGIEVPGVSFDAAYAAELYASAQLSMGQKADKDAGAFLSAAADVLKDRSLIEECYECGDIEGVKLALLERGPVVAGLSWRQSMFAPEKIGGRWVCRAVESPVVGGHAVLLNGIALDMEIGGIKGFVRFKNSWGRGWGDDGHCLISIDNLAMVMDAQDVLLPIPVRGALSPAARQDVAILEAAAHQDAAMLEAEVRYADDSISNDSWTTTDTAGYRPYADAIARGIQHPGTRPPLTIGIRAPWGAGKTSVMRMIQQRLEWPPDTTSPGPGSQRPVSLNVRRAAKTGPRWWPLRASKDSKRITNGALLRNLKQEGKARGGEATPEPTITPLPPSAHDDRWLATVWFNPWIYQTGEQVWAGLAHEIIKQATDRMTPLDRERFWLELNLLRIDEQAVRRKVYGLVVERVLPWLIAGLFLVIAGIVVLALNQGRRLVGAALGGSSAVIVVAGGIQAWNVLRSNISGSLSRLVTLATELRKTAGEQFKGTYDQLVESPDYRSQSGAFHLVQTDVMRVLKLLATPQRPTVIFIDDLDRCSPGTVVQVIEAINLFVAGQDSNVIFVIAMEPEMVAAHIEAAYGDLVKRMAELDGANDQPSDLGWKFLEKIIHLPLSLPVMEPIQKATFYGSLFSLDPALGDPDAAFSEEQVQAAEADLSEVSLGEVVQRAAGATDDDPAAARP